MSLSKKKLKIAILGTSPGWKRAPFDDKSWEIWACNRFALGLERCDRIFEIHRRWNEDDPESPDRKYLADLMKIEPPREVLSIVPIKTLPSKSHIVLDREALFERYGKLWFSSSFGYMLAHAIDQKPAEIGFWGIDMESREEYVVQLAGVRHFIDLARALGIKVHIPDYSLLNRAPDPYPDRFETLLALTFESKAASLDKNIKKLRGRLEHYKEMLHWYKGRLYEADPLNEIRLDSYRKKIEEYEMAVAEWQAALDRTKGELWATQHYRRLFVFNVLPPEIGQETNEDTENSGPT